MVLSQCIKAGSATGEDGYLIAFQYDEQTVELLKRAIPHTHREWRPATKAWWISGEYEEILTEMFANFHSLAHLQGHLW